MPNLKPPVTTVEQAAAYRDRIRAAVPAGLAFEPLMTLLPHRQHAAGGDRPGRRLGFRQGGQVLSGRRHDQFRFRPHRRGQGLRRFRGNGRARPAAPGARRGDRPRGRPFRPRKAFIDTVLAPSSPAFPKLRVVMEHITTQDAAQFVAAAGPQVAATLTAHHLLYNRNAIFQGGVRPHWYLPARPEARDPSGSPGGGGDFRQPQVLPGHRFGAPRPADQRKRPGLRRLLYCLRRPSNFMPKPSSGRRPRPAGGLRQFPTAPTGTVCRATSGASPGQESWAVPADFPYLAGDTGYPCGPENWPETALRDFHHVPSACCPGCAAALAGCINDGATYQIDNTGQHNLSLVREQTFFWDKKITSTSLWPACRPACAAMPSVPSRPRRPSRFWQVPSGAYIIRAARFMYATETQTCGRLRQNGRGAGGRSGRTGRHLRHQERRPGFRAGPESPARRFDRGPVTPIRLQTDRLPPSPGRTPAQSSARLGVSL